MDIVEIKFELAQQLEKSLEEAKRYKNDIEMSKIVKDCVKKYEDEYSYNTIIHYIYWCTDFKIGMLNKALEYNNADNTYLIDQGIIHEQVYDKKCNICKKSEWWKVKSRKQLKCIKNNAKTYICETCEVDIEACSKFYQKYSETKELLKHEIGANFYNNYLKGEHWKKIREEAKVAADKKCQECSSDVKLNVHHKSYANIGKELPDDLMVLCDKCHLNHHTNSKTKSILTVSNG